MSGASAGAPQEVMLEIQKVDDAAFSGIQPLWEFLPALWYTLAPPSVRLSMPTLNVQFDMSNDTAKLLGPHVEGKLCTHGADAITWSSTWTKVILACHATKKFLSTKDLFGDDGLDAHVINVKDEEDRRLSTVTTHDSDSRLSELSDTTQSDCL